MSASQSTDAPVCGQVLPLLPAAVTAESSALHAATQAALEATPHRRTFQFMPIVVPAGWLPEGRGVKQSVPGSSPTLNGDLAIRICREMNANRIQSGGGVVQSWTVRTPRGGGSAFLSIAVSPFIPTGPTDFPPGVQMFEGTRAEFKDYLGRLNDHLVGEPVRFICVHTLESGGVDGAVGESD